MTSLDKVHDFWENNPLWVGESAHEAGSFEFYQEHRTVYIEDCFGGSFDIRFLPPPRPGGQEIRILDLGCGIGFWVTEFAIRGFTKLTAADLTERALTLTRKRLHAYAVEAESTQQNAESMTFRDASFDHVNCQGVIHHTPNTEATVSEIARVLKPGGTASISVYYRNPILKFWPYFRWLGWLLAKLGGGLKGRGREQIFLKDNIDDIVRLYDGDQNPIGKCYTRDQFVKLLEPHFVVSETYLHFFPARTLPIRIPKSVHVWLDKKLGFMIYATVQKKCAE